VELKSAVSENLPSVLADVDRVVQVLSNLLSNALRHTSAQIRH
jgi:signal transduction histidine kinase